MAARDIWSIRRRKNADVWTKHTAWFLVIIGSPQGEQAQISTPPGLFMITELLTSPRSYVPFTALDLSDRSFCFRPGSAVDTLASSLRERGQLEPILLERRAQSYRCLDGFRRIDAVAAIRNAGETWHDVWAIVYDRDQLDDLARFRLLWTRNQTNGRGYHVQEIGRLFQHFLHAGLTFQQIGQISQLSFHDIEDYLDLADADATLIPLLNGPSLPLSHALMLHHRYRGWIRSPYSALAPKIAARILQHAQSEAVSLSAWRFLLDFYWQGDRPFLAISSERH